MSALEIQVSADIAKFKSSMDKAAHQGAQLKKKLSKSFKQIGNAMRSVGALAGVAVAGGIGAMAKKAIDSADKIQKLSTRLGASSEALSQYKHVAELTGITFETLTMGWQRQVRRISEAANGYGEAKGALQELGLSAKQLNQLAPEKQFEVLADAIQKVQSPADKVRLAMKLWDSEGVSMLQTISGGSEALLQMRDSADKLGKTLTKDQVDSAARARDAITNLTASITGAGTQAFLDYSDTIANFADFIRKYLPKALSFVGDSFRGLFVVMQTAILFIQKRLGDLFALAAKLPFGVGKKFEGLALTFQGAAKDTAQSIEDTIDKMGNWKDGGEDVADMLKKDLTPAVTKLAPPTEKTKEEIQRLTKSIAELEKFGKQFADNIPDRLVPSLADMEGALHDVRREATANKISQQQLKDALDNGTIKSVEEMILVANELGIDMGELGKKSETATELMVQGWKKFQDGVQDAFFNAFRSGENFFKSLKNLAFDILAQIAAKIATTFAMDSLANLLDGTKFGSALRSALGGDGKSSAGDLVGQAIGKGIKDGATSILSGTKLGTLLGIGGAASTFSGLAAASTLSGAAIPGAAILGGGSLATTLASTAALPATVTAGATAATAASAGTAAGAAAGASAGAGFWATAGAKIKAVGTGIARFAAAIPGWGWAIAGVAAALAIFKKSGRTQQELGSDQWNAVQAAQRQGRTSAVDLGKGLTFEGGFNEHGVFFSVLGKTQEEMQKIGDIFKRMSGAQGVLALQDGLLRIEDQTQNFSDNHEKVVAQLQAAILEAETGVAQFTGNLVGSVTGALGDINRSAADQYNAYAGRFPRHPANDDGLTGSLSQLVFTLQPLAESASISGAQGQPLFSL